ncbi:MAG: type III-B CRISPR module RAMP protein Cmr1 [Thermoactinomyces sp.]
MDFPSNLEALTVKFCIRTPMFLAGANQAKAEIHLPSIKGMMRYWFRALSEEHVYSRMQTELFGLHSKNIGQSCVQLLLADSRVRYQVIPNKDPKKEQNLVWKIPLFIPPRWKRAYLKENGTFTLQVFLKPLKNRTEIQKEKAWQAVIASLWLMSYVGGLGSQTRRGFGSLEIEEWEGTHDGINSLLKEIQLPQKEAKNVEEYLNQWQKSFRKIRSWFPETKMGRQYTRLNDELLMFIDSKVSNSLIESWKRIGGLFNKVKFTENGCFSFGLPVKNRDDYEVQKGFNNRVASPVWLRMGRLAAGQYFSQVTFFSVPYPKIKVKYKEIEPREGWRLLQELLEKEKFLKWELGKE